MNDGEPVEDWNTSSDDSTDGEDNAELQREQLQPEDMLNQIEERVEEEN